MQKLRITYFVVILIIILTGILSRKFDFIPLFVGDMLYAAMIYFMVRFVFPIEKPHIIFITALLLCFAIELQQLIDIKWLVTIRKTLLGHYILGQGFLWSDLFCYAIAIGLSSYIDTLIQKSK